MRWLCWIVLVLGAGCRTGGFASGGAFYYQPDFESGGRSSGPVGLVAAGTQIPVWEPGDNNLHGQYGIPHPEDVRPSKVLWEVFAGLGDANDDHDLKLVGTGLRLKLGYRRRFYTRFGYTYLASDPDDAHGGHLGLGYDVYLDDQHRWSLAPELMAYHFAGAANGTEDEFSGGSVGVFLTFHWGETRVDEWDHVR